MNPSQAELPSLNYIVCSTPRSGSNLLCLTLKEMGIGAPDEYFNRRKKSGNLLVPRTELTEHSIRNYCLKILEENKKGGVFGMNLHLSQMDDFPELWTALPTLFPGSRYLYLTRKDLFRQAISHTIAHQTGAWSSEILPTALPFYHPKEVRERLQTLTQEMERWEEFFRRHHLSPLRIFYEELEHNFEKTLSEIIHSLGLPNTIPLPPPPLKKQADLHSEEWYRRAIQDYLGNSVAEEKKTSPFKKIFLSFKRENQ